MIPHGRGREQEEGVPAGVPPFQDPLPRLVWVPKVSLLRLGDLPLRMREDRRADVAEPSEVDYLQRNLEPLRNLFNAELLVVVCPLPVVAENQQLVLRPQLLVDMVGSGDRVDPS